MDSSHTKASEYRLKTNSGGYESRYLHNNNMISRCSSLLHN